MKKTIAIVLIIFLFTDGFTQAIRPSVINAAGGSYQSGYHYLEWSIGEMALIGQLNKSDNSFIITNGFIQPYTLKPASGFLGSLFDRDEIKIFPNPASRYIEINFFTKQKGKITFHLFDASGKKIYSGVQYSNGVDLIERIPVSYLSDGVYMLHVELEAYSGYISKKGVYKIVKIQ